MLAYEMMNSQEDPKHSIVLIHGILGSKRNLKGFAQGLISLFPKAQILLVDLPFHGDSGAEEIKPDLLGCAHAILMTVDALHFPLQVIIGHSFGGKVALAVCEQRPVEQVWVLDASPSEAKTSHLSATEIINVLGSLKEPFSSRKEVLNTLQSSGLSHQIAAWMTTNLREQNGGLYWKFNLGSIKEMMASFMKTSFWSLLENNPNRIRFDFVRAERENRFSSDDIKKFEKLGTSGKVHLHLLQNAGHWLHVDNLDGLLELFRVFLV